MSSITWGPRTSGRRVGDRPSAEVGGGARAGAPRAVDVAGAGDRASRRGGVAEFFRFLAGTLAFYAVLIALPFLALTPLVLSGLFLGIVAALFGGRM